MLEIKKWSEIKDRFRDGLILGNGASIAVHDGFGYESLYREAQQRKFLDETAISVFKAFGKDQYDFELVLRRLWYARQVNEALGLSGNAVEKVDDAYQAIRKALIETVRDTHVGYEDASQYFDPIAKFVQGFRTVLSLNYDLVLYWALMYGNNVKLGKYRDCFRYDTSGRLVLDSDWEKYREDGGTTLCFYPHGNLVLGRTVADDELKVKAGGSNLLETVFEKWQAGDVLPVFVCEGTSEQKQRSINGSSYLRQVQSKAFDEIRESIVIYGWRMGPQEQHIIEQILESKPKALAISVRGDNQETVRRANELFSGKIESLVFFDANSPGAWAKSDGSTERQQAEWKTDLKGILAKLRGQR